MGEVIWIEEEDQFNVVVNDNRLVVIDFTAPAWCGPCQRFAPHFERAAEEADEITFVAVDVDKAPWAAVRFGFKSVPTVKLFESGTFVRDIKAPQGALPFLRDIRS